jgi:50S ribosomal protein L16 3-hydroxylase
LARELLQRLADDAEDAVGVAVYRDPEQPATAQPGEIPLAMLEFARNALQDALKDPLALGRALGEYMTEPKPDVWFETFDTAEAPTDGSVRLDRRSKMMFDAQHIFINGESFNAAGLDATLMRRLSNERTLKPQDLAQASVEARALLKEWNEAGWLHGL